MARRVERTLFRIVEIFDYRTFLVAGAFVTLVLVGYLMVGAVQGAHDANTNANVRGQAASRRIDGLQQTIADQAQTISDLKAREAVQAAEQEALARQIRQMGGQPVVNPQPAPTVYVVRPPSPKGKPSRSAPSPRPSATRSPTPRPSPSPTCLVPVLGCRR